MNKLFKSRKALSPVIASIILVAVTVAVSIAVAAWMGALTFSFTKTDRFTVSSMTFFPSAPSYSAINMTIQNTGSSAWTIQGTAQVNSLSGVTVTAMSPTYNHSHNTLNCTNGNTIGISLSISCTSGSAYYVTLLLTDGTKITYEANAP
jgi:flagellin-like protein